MTDIKQLVRELHEKTGIRVSTSDPVVALVVANDIQFGQALETANQQIKAHCNQIVSAVDRAPKKAEEAAVAMLNQAASWMDERIKVATNEAVAQISKAGEVASASIARHAQNEVLRREKFARFVRNWGMTALILVVILAVAWPVGVMIGNMLPLSAKH